MPYRRNISNLTVQRLSCYLRTLRTFSENSRVSVSSGDIAEKVGSTAAQVRKDLSCFGSFGKKGRGYNVSELIATLVNVLGLNKKWNVALIGLGKFGQSLAVYKGFRKSGFDIVAIFEKDPTKIGKRFFDIPVYPIEDITKVCEKKSILLGIIAVPPETADEVIQKALDAGIRGMLNFTGKCGCQVPPHAFVKDVNMAAEIETLSYYLTH